MCLGKRRSYSGLAKWSLAYIQLAALPQRPGPSAQITDFKGLS
jgi:hypothetical protein